jgi:hypothetical protein
VHLTVSATAPSIAKIIASAPSAVRATVNVVYRQARRCVDLPASCARQGLELDFRSNLRARSVPGSRRASTRESLSRASQQSAPIRDQLRENSLRAWPVGCLPQSAFRDICIERARTKQFPAEQVRLRPSGLRRDSLRYDRLAARSLAKRAKAGGGCSQLRTCLASDSLLTGKDTGKKSFSRRFRRFLLREMPVLQRFLTQFPTLANREFLPE